MVRSAVHGSLHTTKDVRQQKRVGSVFRDNDFSHQEPETLLTLVGKSVCIQQRLSFVPSNHQGTVSHFRSQNKNYFCFIDDVLEQTKKERKRNTNAISGGVRRASVRRREEQKKPSAEVVYQKKTKSKNRCVTIRQPLVTGTMNLSDRHLPHEDALQVFSSIEEAKINLKRLLASIDHKCGMAESVSAGNVRQGKESQSGMLEKPEYLEGTYDYFFKRHVQTLNVVIRQQELQEDAEARGIHQEKNCKQVIQLCCGGDIDCDDDASVTTGSAKSSGHHSNGTARYHSFSCDEATGSNRQGNNQNINSNNIFANPSYCDGDDNKVMTDHCEENELTSVNGNSEAGSCQYIQNHGDSNINLNAVSRKINALKLQEIISSPVPIITISHVSTLNESSSTYSESESSKMKQTKTTSVSSKFQLRRSSSLLEVPVTLEDLATEKVRPSLN